MDIQQGLYNPSGSSGGSVRIQDGDGSALADVLTLASSNALVTAIVDGSGTQITSFGGGVQYTEGDVDTTITGTAAMAESPGNVVDVLQLDSSKNLKVSFSTGTLSFITSIGTLNAITGVVTVVGTTASIQSGAWTIGTISRITLVDTLTSITNPVTVVGTITGISGTVAVSTVGTISRITLLDTLTTITNPVTIVGTINSIINPLPSGTNTIGAISTVGTITNPITVNTHAITTVSTISRITLLDTLTTITNPVTITGTISSITNALPSGTNTLGAITTVGTITNAVTVNTHAITTVSTISRITLVDTLTTITNPVTITGTISSILNALPSGTNTLGAITTVGTVNGILAFPTIAALADDESSTGTMSRIGAVMMGMDAAGASNIDRARLSTLFDLDSGAGTQNILGVVLRDPGSGGSTQIGGSNGSNPLQVSLQFNGGASAFPISVSGAIAHDSAASTIAPLLVGGYASTARPTAVSTDLDAVRAWLDLNGIQVVKTDNYQRSDTYTATASGTTIDVTGNPMKYFSIQTVATGAVTSWTILLEGSIDGTNFFTIATSTNAAPVPTGILAQPVRYFRSRCSAIVLGVGTNVIAYILGTF